jgi:mono/diheme cytochrome c family protein
MDAASSGMRGTEMAVLDRVLRASASQSSAAETAIAMISATVLRSGSDADVQVTLALVADANRPPWQRAAVLLGAEIALVPNTPTPGNTRRGAAPSITASAVNTAGAPCPTCPGGRAGPGGAYAFRESGPAAGARGGAGRGRGGAGGGRRLLVSREPSSLTAVASTPGDLQTRAVNVLARIDWPGKPGAASPVTPLTAVEQERFDAGREVYRSVCQACHQPDGLGLERVAPPLVGSVLALAPADVTSRILLNGKEGPVGLMPPIGSTLNDDQIASVLTFIRREWGQAGDPVDPATVRTTRAQTASRTRPWTHDELLAMLPGGR